MPNLFVCSQSLVMKGPDTTEDWQIFDSAELIEKVRGDQPRLYEFLHTASLSSVVYHLPAGCRDLQAPHLEDEIYVVLEGKARIRIGDTERQAKPGSVLFVRATMKHSFVDIEEDLTVLAFFGSQP